MDVTTIKNQEEYERRLTQIEALIDLDPQPGSRDFEVMSLLGLVISAYESSVFPPPAEIDPVDSIEFVMDQQGLTRKDLEAYIGPAGRVSEVMNRKRPLSKEMIRKLHSGLGIPADILLREPASADRIEFSDLPVRELAKRGWVIASPREATKRAAELMAGLCSKFRIEPELQPAHYRRTVSPGATQADPHALALWRYLILAKAQSERLDAGYDPQSIDDDFLKQLRGLSRLRGGPRLAKELLGQVGIHLVFEPHFSKTRLDGAATALVDGTPVIGMTLRHDRLDNFWFVLFHELAHVVLHLPNCEEKWFVDDLDAEDTDAKEYEADFWAQENLIPSETWEGAHCRVTRNAQDVREFARQHGVGSSVIAGRLRREVGNYKLLYQMVGQGAVRSMFEADLLPLK